MIQWISILRTLAMIMIVICHVIGDYTFIPGHAHLNQFLNVGMGKSTIILLIFIGSAIKNLHTSYNLGTGYSL